MWQKAPTILTLAPNEVHVWRARQAELVDQEARFWATLAEDERQRADRFHFPIHCSEYVTSRGILRQLLGHYLEQAPEDLVFAYGAQGKPFLPANKSLSFNISHSHGLALFAFAWKMEIGVDVEKVDTNIDVKNISSNFFASKERSQLLQLDGPEQFEAFFRCWTRKEAFIKAKGQGLSLPLDQFEVSLLPEEPAQLMVTRWEHSEASTWQLQALAPGAGFAGALALRGEAETLHLWEF